MVHKPLHIYRRHNRRFCHLKANEIGCNCPISVYGPLNGETIRKSLDTRSWTQAAGIVAGWIEEPKRKIAQEKKKQEERQAKQEEKIPRLGAAVAKWLTDVESTGKRKAASTLTGYRNSLRHVIRFKGAECPLDQVSVDDIRTLMALKFAAGNSDRTRKKWLEAFRQFFGWCAEADWIRKNPCVKSIKIVVSDEPVTLPLDDDQVLRMVDACDQLWDYNRKRLDWTRKRAKALVLGMAFTGFRISDITTLRRSEVQPDGRSLNHVMIKTERKIFTKFGEMALTALLELPPVYEDYFFWNPKTSKRETAIGVARKTIYRVAKKAGILPEEAGGRQVHPHRFRATFSRKVLSVTGDIRVLQKLLGHRRLETTQKSYEHEVPEDIERREAALDKIEYRRDATTGRVIQMPHRG